MEGPGESAEGSNPEVEEEVSEDDRPFALRPLRGSHARSSRGVPPLLVPDGPTVVTQTLDPLEFLIRVR